MKKVVTAVWGLISNLWMFFLILALLFTLLQKMNNGDSNLFGYQFKTVLSGSMEPEFMTGSIIAVKQVSSETTFSPGDIVTYMSKENTLITHRIIDVKKNQSVFITKGDNNTGADVEPLLAHNIVGKYTGLTIPYIGYVLQIVNSKQGALWFLVLPGILLLGQSFLVFWNVYRTFVQSKRKINSHMTEGNEIC